MLLLLKMEGCYMTPVKILPNVMVEMRDGIKLSTDIYLPDGDGAYPVQLIRSPYSITDIRDHHALGIAAEGFITVRQDCRGCNWSEGEFHPMINEAFDGEDTLNWIVEQDWCDGRIILIGGSYCGSTQWMAGWSGHPALIGLTPAVAGTNIHDSTLYSGGAFQLNTAIGWGLSRVNSRLEDVVPLNEEKLTWHLPLIDIVHEADRELPFWNSWIGHPDYSDYWQAIDLNLHYSQVKVPALISGGWYDIYSKQTLESFSGMQQQAGTEAARQFSRCIVGPWGHSLGGRVTGELDFGEVAELDLMAIQKQFKDNLLEDSSKDPLPDMPSLRIFVMGKNYWRDEESWPLPNTDLRNIYLRKDNCLSYELPAEDEGVDTYIYDPANPVPTLGGNVLCLPSGPFDQTEIETRDDVLVFSSDILEDELEVIGNIKVVLYAATDVKDTDFTAKLVDVYPDGRAINLCNGIIRARYRNSHETQELLEPGQVYEYEIDCWVTANVFLPGHQIRLEISSSNFPQFDRNPNTGNPFGLDAEMKVANQIIYHSAKYPSRIILPVVL
jgi:putative CocE/NonD family hydrolase